MVFWNPDSCLCRIEIDLNFNFVSWEKKCEIHKNFNGSELLTEVLKHIRSFNYLFGNIDLTRTQKDAISQNKKEEITRIKLLGKGIEK